MTCTLQPVLFEKKQTPASCSCQKASKPSGFSTSPKDFPDHGSSAAFSKGSIAAALRLDRCDSRPRRTEGQPERHAFRGRKKTKKELVGNDWDMLWGVFEDLIGREGRIKAVSKEFTNMFKKSPVFVICSFFWKNTASQTRNDLKKHSKKSLSEPNLHHLCYLQVAWHSTCC